MFMTLPIWSAGKSDSAVTFLNFTPESSTAESDCACTDGPTRHCSPTKIAGQAIDQPIDQPIELCDENWQNLLGHRHFELSELKVRGSLTSCVGFRFVMGGDLLVSSNFAKRVAIFKNTAEQPGSQKSLRPTTLAEGKWRRSVR